MLVVDELHIRIGVAFVYGDVGMVCLCIRRLGNWLGDVLRMP